MALLAMCMPILPGKKDKWLKMMDELQKEPMKSNFDKSRENAGVYERSFLQETPNGDFVILTFEGEDPVAGWGKIMANIPVEFSAAAKEIHGIAVAGALGLSIPLLMAFEGWDDHDRSQRYTAREFAKNYLK